MKLIDLYLEYLHKNEESFAVDAFPPKTTIIKKKKRIIVSEQNKKEK